MVVKIIQPNGAKNLAQLDRRVKQYASNEVVALARYERHGNARTLAFTKDATTRKLIWKDKLCMGRYLGTLILDCNTEQAAALIQSIFPAPPVQPSSSLDMPEPRPGGSREEEERVSL